MYKNVQQREFARNLRNEMTDAERHFWNLLRCEQLKGFKFRRQAAIGEYIVDFVCFPQKLIIELDGGQHNQVSVKVYDEARTSWLKSQGFRVLRFWNHDVLESADNIVDVIWNALLEAVRSIARPPSPALPTEGRESEK